MRVVRTHGLLLWRTSGACPGRPARAACSAQSPSTPLVFSGRRVGWAQPDALWMPCVRWLAFGRPSLVLLSLLCVDVSDGEDKIPLQNVDARILAKVIEYMKYHFKLIETPQPEDEVRRWDREFVRVDKSTLFHLVLVRCSLRGWLSFCCSLVAFTLILCLASALYVGRAGLSVSLLGCPQADYLSCFVPFVGCARGSIFVN